MLRDADPSSFSAVYLVCGYTDMRYGMDTLAAIIEQRYHLPLFVPDTLFLFCGRSAGNKSYMWVYCTGESESIPSSSIITGVPEKRIIPMNFSGTIPGYW